MKQEQIIKLFSEHFKTNNFLKKGKANGFSCPYQNKCKLNPENEPIWSPALGSGNSNLMIVAEAPSARGKKGAGPHIGGCIANWTDENSIIALLNFVEKYYGSVPHFTDIMKCGVSSQTRQNKKAVFDIRTKNCIEHFLLKEIEIINPEIILCVGAISFKALEQCKKDKRIKDTIELIHLLHYSNSASLKLSYKDKQNFIWPHQIGKLVGSDMKELSSFKKWSKLSTDNID